MNTKSTTTWGQAPRLDSLKTIGQLIQHLPFNCRFNTHTGKSFHTTTPQGTTHVHALCHQLRCRTCAHLRYHELHRALRQGCHDQALNFYCTLTLQGGMQLEQQDLIIKRALGRLLQEARRTFKGQSLIYAWALGIGAGNNLHVNMLLNKDIRRGTRYRKRIEFLKSTWFRLTGAHQVRLQPIRPDDHAFVIQYILVDMFRTVLAVPHLKRRCGASRTIKLREPSIKDPNDTRRWVRSNLPTAHYARVHGIEADPIMNGTFLVNDAPASSTPSRAESPLHTSDAAGGTRVPAGDGGGVGVPVPLIHGRVQPA